MDPAITAQMQRLDTTAIALKKSMQTLYDTVMELDRKDPKFTATMRRYGILPQLSALFTSIGDLTGQVSPLFRMIEETLSKQ